MSQPPVLMRIYGRALAKWAAFPRGRRISSEEVIRINAALDLFDDGEVKGHA